MAAPQVEVQATAPVHLEAEDTVPMVGVEVGVALVGAVDHQEDTRVDQVASLLKAEGDIPTGPRHLKIVSHLPSVPATVKDTIQRVFLLRTEMVYQSELLLKPERIHIIIHKLLYLLPVFLGVKFSYMHV